MSANDAARSRRTMLLAAIIVVATVVAYVPALAGGFIWDDDDYVTENPHLRDIDGLMRIWSPGSTRQYYPLVFTTFWIESALWGLGPDGEFRAFGFHAVNLALHIINALLLWRLCVVLRIPGAWVIGAAFALHPVHVESVAWITERKNVLSLCFYLLAALSYLRFEQVFPPAEPGAKSALSATDSHRRDWGWYVLSLLLFVAALLSKTVTCSLPAALILVFLWLHKPLTVRRVALLMLFFIVGFRLALHTAHLEKLSVGAVGPEFDLTLVQRMLIASNALVFYPVKLIWPHPLIFIYPRWPIDDPSLWMYLALIAAALIAIAAVWSFFRWKRGPALAVAFFAGTIFPALGFFDVYPMRYSFVADHFQYHASIGIIALIAGGGAALLPRRLAVAICTIVLAAFVPLTWATTMKYRDAGTLWRDTAAQNPQAWIAQNGVGVELLEAHEFEKAIPWFEQSLAVKPDHYEARRNLAMSLLQIGRVDDALIEFHKARQTFIDRYGQANPDDDLLIGQALELRGDKQAAIESYQRVLQADADSSEAHFRLAVLAHEIGRMDDAAMHFASVLKRDPTNVTANVFLADRANQRGRFDRVASHLQAALRGASEPADRLQVHVRLSWFLATCPSPEHRDGTEALRHAENVLEAENSPVALDLKAAALAELGRFEEAATLASSAAAAARQAGQDALAEGIALRLDAYQRRVPWRSSPFGVPAPAPD